MGIKDKIKNVFKKGNEEKKEAGKEVKAEAKKEAKAVSAKPGMDFSGSSLEKELEYAAAKIDDAVAAGKFSDARGDAFRAQLKGIYESKASDDERRILIGRVIGGVINGI